MEPLTPTRFAALAAVSLLTLTACGVGGADVSDTDASSAAEGEITGEITFQTWNLKASFQDYFEGVIADFEEEYPGTSVEWIDQPADGYADKADFAACIRGRGFEGADGHAGWNRTVNGDDGADRRES